MRKLLQTTRGWQVKIFKYFNKNYINNKLQSRTGKCQKCGKCCRDCTYLNRKTNLCTLYKNRPNFGCYKEFPLDDFDKKLWNVEQVCGYKFKN